MLALSSAIVDAQQSTGISANASDPGLLSLQAKVDGLFARGEYERAYFIYRKELVPLGDKYAQYMVGYLHLTGMGADEDPVLASAWYRLAAERGTPEFIALRDELMRALPPAQRQRSDALYMDLKRQYSDVVILLGSIKDDFRELELMAREGLRPRSARPDSRTGIQNRLIRQIEEKLRTLSELGDFAGIDMDYANVDIDEVERLVNERIVATEP